MNEFTEVQHEAGNLSAWSSTTGGVTIVTTSPHGGGNGGARSLRLNNAANVSKNLDTALSELFYGFALNWETRPTSTEAKILVWKANSTEIGSIRYDGATQKLRAYTGTGTLVATGSATLGADAWYRLVVRVKVADSGGVISVEVDGVSDISFTGDTKPGSDTTVSRFEHNSVNLAALLLDDMSLNSTSNADGLGETGAPPNLYWVYIPVDGPGDVTGLTPTGSGTNWQNVDEITLNGADYNASAVNGTYDFYALVNHTLGSGQTIAFFEEVATADALGAGVGQPIQLGIKSTNQHWGSNVAAASAPTAVRGTRRAVNPDTGVALTQSELNALQVGFKVA